MAQDQYGEITGYSRIINGERVWPNRQTITGLYVMQSRRYYVDLVDGVLYTGRISNQPVDDILFKSTNKKEALAWLDSIADLFAPDDIEWE